MLSLVLIVKLRPGLGLLDISHITLFAEKYVKIISNIVLSRKLNTFFLAWFAKLFPLMSQVSHVPLKTVSCPSFKCFTKVKLLRQYNKISVPTFETILSLYYTAVECSTS